MTQAQNELNQKWLKLANATVKGLKLMKKVDKTTMYQVRLDQIKDELKKEEEETINRWK